ncbi:ABC transporter ATP-binding protein [Corynebacterium mayonis]|uniref:ABC transporter ATP-binding protein n=1 Tax=Corynebacterium mayonis TaxID=3062461 RepID=UPI00313FFE29
MSGKPTVVFQNVSKNYEISKDGSRVFLPWKKKTVVHAVRNASFVAYEGESIGVLGPNGSGKSTLLSMMAGNEDATAGTIMVADRPSLLSVSAALQNHLSGYDNVLLGLLAKGLKLDEAKALVEEIAEWTAIGDAINRPLSTYSSGMGARLKFAISTAVHPKILLVDEALATGDASFNARAQSRMKNFLEGSSTVVIVSHSSSTIKKHCTRAIWLHEGEIVTDVPAKSAIKWYDKWSHAKAKGDDKYADDIIAMLKRFYTPPTVVFDDAVEELFCTRDRQAAAK